MDAVDPFVSVQAQQNPTKLKLIKSLKFNVSSLLQTKATKQLSSHTLVITNNLHFDHQ